MSVTDVRKIHEMGKDQEGFKVADSQDSCFWSLRQIEQWVEAKQDVLLVAEVDHEIAGFLLSIFHRPTCKATIENVFVVPRHRDGSLWKTLMDDGCTRLKQMGATYIHYLVRSNNPYLPVFGRAGFQRGYEFTWFGKQA
jgi:hypothetical protein